jgi:oxygen-dependent protoporphyrinogen oxidase
MRLAVLGGGISGLAAALRAVEAREERGLALEVTVFERGPRAGGCVQTLQDSGYTMELGADSLLAEKPAARDLLRRLNLEDELVPMRPEYRGARIVLRGRLRPIPSDFRFFTPTSLPALLRSGLFTPAGIARAAIEPFVPPRKDDADESLASFVTRRFGREVLDRLAQPLIGGIYSGDPQRLSMQATLPQFLEMERKYGSLLRAMTSRSGANRSAQPLMSLRGGLQRIVDAMLERIGPAVRLSSQVQQVTRTGDAWTIRFADGASAQADAIVCTLPAYAAAHILRAADADLAQMLDSIRYNSIATVNLAYDAADATGLPATPGFVVPALEGRRITAATISTQKYPDRSPQDGILLRAFIGGALQPQLVDLGDAQLAQVARDEIADLLGITAEPRFAVTRRWLRLLPEYGIGHVSLVTSIEQRAARLGGLALAGSAYRGVGIPDCVATGVAAADVILQAWEDRKSG